MPPLAPRPFVQLARRCWRLRLPLPLGYAGSISAAPWYRRQRRRGAVALHPGRAAVINARRSSRVYWRVCPPLCEVW